ncbi:MAG: hypothetical protein LPK00_05125 [Bacillaceae bacterium]|nr:hypothetical protein [Bacillaceae bacterium]
MKKVVVGILTFMLLLSVTFGVSAEKSKKEIAIEVSTLVEVVEVNELLEVQAVNQKKGSYYSIDWRVTSSPEGAQYNIDETSRHIVPLEVSKFDTDGNETKEYKDHYVSTAGFTSDTPGTYVLTAYVTMTAGNSHVSWNGENSTEVEVEEPVQFNGFTVETTNVVEVKNPQGKVTGYTVHYIVFANYSNGTFTVEETSTNFNPNHSSKNVTFVYQGETFTITVIK